ncbi:hypothetical protein CRUP_013389 [Coryphaenoides rupestris]|nr:hypothetical protein CRUP_013389 [Coryphaenoides rupestris]
MISSLMIIKLLDGKRSQAVGILISSLHLEMKDIQHAPHQDSGGGGGGGAAEQQHEPRPWVWVGWVESSFLDGIASIQRKVEIVSSVSTELLGSSVREVIGLVLAFGNYMNGGNRTRGQADGFGLEILPKLKDVKSRDNKISLVDYVVSYYLRNSDEHAGTDKSVFPLPEPQDFFQAAQVKFDDLTKDARKLKRELTGRTHAKPQPYPPIGDSLLRLWSNIGAHIWTSKSSERDEPEPRVYSYVNGFPAVA